MRILARCWGAIVVCIRCIIEIYLKNCRLFGCERVVRSASFWSGRRLLVVVDCSRVFPGGRNGRAAGRYVILRFLFIVVGF